MGVYCADCNSWICWTTFDKMRKIQGKVDESTLNDHMAIRKFKVRNGTKMILCSKCGCLLYNSKEPPPQSQFNLLAAKFCPNCGRELL